MKLVQKINENVIGRSRIVFNRLQKAGRVTFWLSIWCLCLSVLTIHAETFKAKKGGLDLVFVVDCSNSMNYKDKDHLALEMIDGFTNLFNGENVRVGFVAYNDQILASVEPIEMSDEEKKSQLSQMIKNTGYVGNTDIGLALNHAVSFLDPDDGRDKLIILLSDGETDLRWSNTGRTKEISDADAAQAVAFCQEKGIPIHTIAFGSAYDGSKGQLQEISQNTNGILFDATGPDDLIQIFYQAIAPQADLVMIPVTESIYGDGYQNVRYSLKNRHFRYITCFLISSSKLNEVSLSCNEEEVPLTVETYFSRARIETAGGTEDLDISLNARTNERQRLNLYLIGSRDLTAFVQTETTVMRQEDNEILIGFEQNHSQQPLEQSQLYQNMNVTCNLYQMAGDEKKEISQISLTPTDNGLKGVYQLPQKGEYILEAAIEDELESYYFEPILLNAVNEAPTGDFPEQFVFSTLNGRKEFDLDEYFTGFHNETLEYRLVDQEGDSVEVSIERGRLSWKPKRSGTTVLTFAAVDSQQDLIEKTTTIIIEPLWKYYLGIWTGFLAVAAILIYLLRRKKNQPEEIVVYLEKPKNDFTGKLNAYFTKLPDGMEISPLTFALYQLKERKITLGNLFEEYADVVDLLELQQIELVAGENRNLLIRNHGKALVMIGNSMVCRNMTYQVDYGSVIYIMIDDLCELELHYVSILK